MNQLHFLVVEDEATNREIAEVILRNEGHLVTSRENGNEALELLIEQGLIVDAAIVDIQMPGMNGLELTKRLRATPATERLPILCLSARASGSDKEAGLEAGADGYLTKPYSRKELIRAIDEVLIARGVLSPEESIARKP